MFATSAFRLAAAGLALALVATACGDDATSDPTADPTDGAITSLADFGEGLTVGVQSGTTGEAYANENIPEGGTVRSFDDPGGLFPALESGAIDGVLQDIVVNQGRALEDDSVHVVETYPTDENYGFAVEEGNAALLAAVNGALAKVMADGTYASLYGEWFPGADVPEAFTSVADPGDVSLGDATTIAEGSLTVCTDAPYPPMEFEDPDAEGGYSGFDIELVRAMAGVLDLGLVVVNPGFDPITSGAVFAAGDCDLAAASITITDEREENIDFTDPYFQADQSLLVKKG